MTTNIEVGAPGETERDHVANALQMLMTVAESDEIRAIRRRLRLALTAIDARRVA